MAALRKQGKGITGTLTDDEGNSTSISVDDKMGAKKKWQANLNKQIAKANKEQRPIIEEEGKEGEYDGFKYDKSLWLNGWMVKCPPGMKELPIPEP